MGELAVALGAATAAAVTVVAATGLAMLWARRDRLAVRMRGSRITALFCVVFWATCVRNSLQLAGQGLITCAVLNPLLVLTYLASVCIYLLRAWDTFYKFERSHTLLRPSLSFGARSSAELVSAERALLVVPQAASPRGKRISLVVPVELLAGSVDMAALNSVDQRWYFRRSTVAWVALLLCGPLVAAAAWTLAATNALHQVARPFCGFSMHPVLRLASLWVMVVGVSVGLPIAWRIRDLEDRLGIKRELKLVVVLAATSQLVDFILFMLRGPEGELELPLNNLTGFLFNLAILVTAVAIPVSRSAPLSSKADAALMSLPLEEALRDKNVRRAFAKFLADSFCAEALLFWDATDEFIELLCRASEPSAKSSSAWALTQATRIFRKFLARDAPLGLNLPGAIAAEAKQRLAAVVQSGHSDVGALVEVFEPARQSVFRLLRDDPYARFKGTPQFQRLAEARQLGFGRGAPGTKRPGLASALPPLRLHIGAASPSAHVRHPNSRGLASMPLVVGVASASLAVACAFQLVALVVERLKRTRSKEAARHVPRALSLLPFSTKYFVAGASLSLLLLLLVNLDVFVTHLLPRSVLLVGVEASDLVALAVTLAICGALLSQADVVGPVQRSWAAQQARTARRTTHLTALFAVALVCTVGVLCSTALVSQQVRWYAFHVVVKALYNVGLALWVLVARRGARLELLVSEQANATPATKCEVELADKCARRFAHFLLVVGGISAVNNFAYAALNFRNRSPWDTVSERSLLAPSINCWVTWFALLALIRRNLRDVWQLRRVLVSTQTMVISPVSTLRNALLNVTAADITAPREESTVSNSPVSTLDGSFAPVALQERALPEGERCISDERLRQVALEVCPRQTLNDAFEPHPLPVRVLISSNRVAPAPPPEPLCINNAIDPGVVAAVAGLIHVVDPRHSQQSVEFRRARSSS